MGCVYSCENKPNQSLRYIQNGWFMIIVTLELLDKEREESCWLPGTSRKTTDTDKFNVIDTVDVQISVWGQTGLWKEMKKNMLVRFKITGESCTSTNSKRGRSHWVNVQHSKVLMRNTPFPALVLWNSKRQRRPQRKHIDHSLAMALQLFGIYLSQNKQHYWTLSTLGNLKV